ncbi:MAG: hypothetical protein ACT4OJ_10805 [Bacteroidota bacterium]
MQRCLAAGAMPGEYWNMSFEETLLLVKGYEDRVNVQWQQTRLVIYAVAATVTDPDKRGEVYDLFYIPGDPSPEQRAREAQRIHEELMQASKDFTAELRREIKQGQVIQKNG